MSGSPWGLFCELAQKAPIAHQAGVAHKALELDALAEPSLLSGFGSREGVCLFMITSSLLRFPLPVPAGTPIASTRSCTPRKEAAAVVFPGRLELTIPDLLQFLSRSGRTGKLTLTRCGGSGIILFRDGKIVYAAADAVRNSLGSILVSQGQLGEDALMGALDLQHMAPEWKRLGAILVGNNLITRQVLEGAIQHQIKQVVREFLTWERGFFRFDRMEVDCEDGIVVECKDFLVEAGMDADHVLLEGQFRLDEQRASLEPKLFI